MISFQENSFTITVPAPVLPAEDWLQTVEELHDMETRVNGRLVQSPVREGRAALVDSEGLESLWTHVPDEGQNGKSGASAYADTTGSLTKNVKWHK